PLQLDENLSLGEWRRLTAEELAKLEVFDIEL
ncbi:MAG: 16S rRNA pseudouridine(516) synthase, partial [Streptococcus lutetiensis]|nr:16S rRNA pseudouridine(516) synthase [Streptococcus lutetiensis]